MTFYREVMGLDGLIRRAFPSLEAMAEFEQTETYRQIHRMVAELRKQPPPKDLGRGDAGHYRRIPQSLHEALRIEAYEHHTSMNKLCISKLLQFIDTENVPTVFDEKACDGRKKRRKPVYKPGFVRRPDGRRDDHFSRKSIARFLQQSTRESMAGRTDPLGGWRRCRQPPMLPV